METQKFAADWPALTVAERWLTEACGRLGIAGDTLYAAQVCFEELATNVVRHREANTHPQHLEPGTIEVTISRNAEQVTLVIEDNAAAFDITAAMANLQPAAVGALEIGGLGLTLVKSMATSIDYTRLQDGNRTVLTFTLADQLDKTPSHDPSTDRDTVPESLELLLQSGEEFDLAAGAVLIRQGEQDDHAYSLRQGSLEVYDATPFGDVHLATVHAPALVGEIAALAGISRTASVRAAGDAQLSRISSASLLAIGTASPSLFVQVIRKLGHEIESTNKAIGLYTNALTALEQGTLDADMLDALTVPTPQTAAFASAFNRFAREIAAKHRQQEELASAALIQRSFLPAMALTQGLPDGLKLEACMRPARQVGGDFYDFQALDAHRVLLVVGDVCGKGLPASLFMSVAITTLRSVAKSAGTAAAIAAAANELLCANNAGSLFATAIIAILDTQSGELQFCNCGHCPLVLMTRSGQLRSFAATGLPLGLYAGKQANVITARVEPGETLLLFSDGISEALNEASEEFGEERLMTLLPACAEMHAATIITTILSHVEDFAGDTEQADDITCLVLQLMPN